MIKEIKKLFHIFEALFWNFVTFNPSKHLIIIGVTGTKGKTTVSDIISQSLDYLNINNSLLNSIRIKILKNSKPNTSKMTTPGRGKIHRFLKKSLKLGVKVVILEMSSEGLAQYRHLGIKFDIGIITNLAKEHIKSHGGFENYKKAKGMLFRNLEKNPNSCAILNLDDPYFSYFNSFKVKNKLYYAIKSNSKYKQQLFKGKIIKMDINGSIFEINGNLIKSKLIGEFNLYNLLACFCALKALKIKDDKIIKALESINPIPSRIEFVKTDPFNVIVDFAHTPESFEAFFKTIKTILPEKKIISVFGSAGGIRDKEKRPKLGKIAGKYSDIIILTNEDPWDTPPEEILNDIEKGLDKSKWKLNKNYFKIQDRKNAIFKALDLAEKDTIVAILGKGEERLMIIGKKKIPWYDKNVIKDYFEDSEVD